MYANVIPGNGLHHVTNNSLNFIGQRTAIRIAKYNPARTLFISGLCAGQCIFWISLIAVKEMFAVEENLPALRFRSADAVSNRGEVFLVGGLESDLDVVIPRFGDKAD